MVEHTCWRHQIPSPFAVMAQRFWPNQDAIGKRLFVSWTEPEKPLEVVGIVGNTRERGLARTRPLEQMYVPDSQTPLSATSVVIRTAGPPLEILPAATRAIHEMDRQQPVVDAETLDQIIAFSYSDRRLNMLLLIAFGGLALLLAAAGIYGVLSCSVRQRVREIGIRLALGARIMDVLWMVLSEGMRPALLGIALGVAGALALGRLLAGMIYGVPPNDLRTFAAGAAVLAGVALVSSIVPAYRATRIEPLDVLREE